MLFPVRTSVHPCFYLLFWIAIVGVRSGLSQYVSCGVFLWLRVYSIQLGAGYMVRWSLTWQEPQQTAAASLILTCDYDRDSNGEWLKQIHCIDLYFPVWVGIQHMCQPTDNSEFGAGAILSLRNLRQGIELNKFGGVIITAANRTDITEIMHLKVQQWMGPIVPLTASTLNQCTNEFTDVTNCVKEV